VGIHIGLATPADDAHIRGLLRREPVPGRIAISYEREPEFSRGCDATGENATVLVARDLDTGIMAGVACRSEREVYVNGTPVRLGYFGQLRIDRRYRGRWLVSRGFLMLRQLHDRDPLPGYLAAVTVDNQEAEAILVRSGRKRFPAFHPVASYCTLALPVRRPTNLVASRRVASRVSSVASATVGDIPEIVCFLQTTGPRRQFFPVWSEARLISLTTRLGLRIEDVQIARRSGRIAGLIGLWDQSAYKQDVVRSYSGWMRLAPPLYNAVAPWIGRPRLPKTGERIRSGYAVFTCIEQDSPSVFGDLLSATLHRAAARGLDYVLMGLDERDPLFRTARERPHIPYRSRLFLAEWPEGGHLHAQLDHRPTCVEIATL
jgi:hypothetical protein